MRKLNVARLFAIILFCCGFNVYSGDIAVFNDLGFSEDGKYYIFAQYGVEEATLLPWAEMCVVDATLNDFVRGGRLLYRHNREIEAGQDGSGALWNLISQNTALAARFGVNFLRQGVPLYISFEEGHKPAGESIEFRDFESGAMYKAVLVPTYHGSGEALKSSFIINLEQKPASAASRFWTVGTPDVRRAKITSYTIKKALMSPDRSSLVFVIEMTRQNKPELAPDIRYMIETVRVK
ncbi:MAG: DUF2259 domain-containing protein [Spirochaetaceae bacterium]|jgi:predicted secreted protein|nr:DUF2259 domain-containing protein [Spirochaetaceae bacterium]GMO19764.1 MAG: DUF2259 domain-containing protein [Termitinemataceae bacterium]